MIKKKTRWFHQIVEHLPLRWRLAIVSFGLLTIILITSGIILSLTEEYTLISNQATVLSTQASIVVGANSPLLPKSSGQAQPLNSALASDLVKKIQNSLGRSVQIAILSDDGKPLAYSDPRHPFLAGNKEFLKQDKSSTSYSLVSNAQGQREMVVWYRANVLLDKQTMDYAPVYLQLSTPTSQIDSVIATTRLIQGLITLVALVIAGLLTLPLIRQALRPLVEMEQVSGRIADGELSLRLREPVASDEVGRLAQAFNRMVARLEKMLVRQKQFVADVSHELRTPLTGLSGSLEMLLLEANNGDTEAALRLMRGMYAVVERMQLLVGDLLILSRLDEGQIVLRRPRRVEPGPLIAEVCEQIWQQFPDHDHLEIHNLDAAWATSGDPEQLRRVFHNLLENACKFTPPSGTIAITVGNEPVKRQGKAMLCVQVRDSGIGIPEEALEHVFERFYRVDQSRTRGNAPGGSGLGLSIVDGIVRAHGGSVCIESVLNRGTTVIVYLPVLEGDR
ncbi:sensor histidine kinase [Dictyobacter formicarum]|uniref:histidine kinase n=1 Tax=Dictyobacter formicarum TaxID=2778368 RepID=A0ABQ3VK39_9CHLR|nr:HAMP domain-containing sensor histidine kinase [Dictyobacter formicarum]GHO85973.1 hypothetical protein KSZ_39790 [Dictyobacter formicarum]